MAAQQSRNAHKGRLTGDNRPALMRQVMVLDLLTVKEVAALKQCSERNIQQLIKSGELTGRQERNPANNRMRYMVPAEELPDELQRKYYGQLRKKSGLEPELAQPPKTQKPVKPARAFDELTPAEREEITTWTAVLQEWQNCRAQYDKKTEADTLYVSMCKLTHPELSVSVDILYRKWAAYKSGNPEGLLDGRGGWNRGQCGIPPEVWDWFLTAYLDERQLSITQCYRLAQCWIREFCPDLLASLPGERTFRRQADKLSKAVVTLGRQDNKAYTDRCAPYIVRLYDDLMANDYWIADNHTLDIISKREDGTEATHRLSLTAFIDARSGVFVGWNLTDNPCSQSTVIALRHAIQRFGIPKAIYFDNGSEFLTYDLAGRGHRSRKSQSLVENPPGIFARLGIEMRNALVRNAKAKPIERTFCTFKGQLSRMFETFCGGTILERPESLKYTLKEGRIPLDGQLRVMIADYIDGVYNIGAYGGAVEADRGKRRIDIWNNTIKEQRVAAAEDLNLMLMRSTRTQKVARNGVYITIAGEKLFYWNADTWRHFGEEVYVRYDPAELDTVRVYDKQDRYMMTLPIARSTMVKFADSPDAVKVAQEDVRRVNKAVKQELKAIKGNVPKERSIDMLDLMVRSAHLAKDGMVIQSPRAVVPIRSAEKPLQKAVGAPGEVIPIDMRKMNQNAAVRRKK